MAQTKSSYKQSPSNNKITLAYFGLRGRTIPIKPLLHYLKIDYKEKVYGEAGEYFGKDKLSLDVPFINMPYLIDGDLKISETDAIMQYIIEKSGKVELQGKNLQDRAKVRQIESMLTELIDTSYVLARAPKEQYKQQQQEVRERLYDPKIKQIDAFLQGKEWIMGYLTVCDFKLFHLVEHLNAQDTGILKNCKNILAHAERFVQLDSYQSYFKSKHYAPGVLPPFTNYFNCGEWSVMSDFAKLHEEN